MNFNVEYSSFIECWIITKVGDAHGETLVRLLSVPRPGDFISLGFPNHTTRDYEVNRVTHRSHHTSSGEIKPGTILIHCTEVAFSERLEKF